MHWKKSVAVKNLSADLKKLASSPLAVRAGAVGLVVCAIAAAMLVAGRQSAAKVQTDTTASAESATARKTPAMQVQRNSATTTPPAVESAAKSEEPTLVTITGCLERNADTYRLKDTTGADAPKSRSWKSGFLKKSAARVEVNDAANRLRLSNHVGRRVSVTGMLVDQEMQGRSVRRIAESCN